MYTVIVLAEQALTASDAAEIVSLHESFEEERRYHVIIPCENAAAQVEAALGSLAASEVLAAPPMMNDEIDVEETQREIDDEARGEVEQSVTAIRAAGQRATGEFSCEDPVAHLASVVEGLHGNEVVVMTEHHIFKDFLHIDWASRARRKLGIPVLHLMEHESLDAESGAGEGASLL